MTSNTIYINHIIGGQIRARRKELGLRAADLGRSTGLSCSFLSDLENGKRGVSAENLFLISKPLGVDVNYFFEPLKGSAS